MDIKLIVFLVISWMFGSAAFIGTVGEFFDNKKIKWLLALFSWASIFGFVIYATARMIIEEIKDDLKSSL